MHLRDEKKDTRTAAKLINTVDVFHSEKIEERKDPLEMKRLLQKTNRTVTL